MSTVAKFERDLLETNERYRSAKSPNFTYVCVVCVCGGGMFAPHHISVPVKFHAFVQQYLQRPTLTNRPETWKVF